MSALLEVHGLEAFYGQTKALHGVSFSMAAGGITTILGANGAGKTTTLRAISRMVRTAGTIRFEGQPLEARATEDIVQFGIAHAPEGRGTFVHLTVEENLKVGAWGRRERGGSEVDSEAAAPDGYRAILREVHVRGNVVVLVSHVALERRQSHVARARHGRIILGVCGLHQQHLDVGTVRGLEIREAQHPLPVLQPIQGRGAVRLMRAGVELTFQ